MTDRFSIWLFLIIGSVVALDLYMGWGGMLFLTRKLFELVDVLVFWR